MVFFGVGFGLSSGGFVEAFVGVFFGAFSAGRVVSAQRGTASREFTDCFLDVVRAPFGGYLRVRLEYMSRFPDVPVTDLPDDAVFLDIREQHEWDAGHAPGAVHIPLGQIAERLDEIRDLAGDRQLIVTCKGGGRVRRTLPSLAEYGLDVANLEGGMKAWHEAGKAMESADGSTPTVA